ncbi:MAG: hypothetical protein ACOYVG_03730 [Bacteroidota bacterium]
MKNKLKELDVDFIGGQKQPITKEEELAISNFIRKQKAKRQLQITRGTKTKVSKKSHQPA